MAIRLSSRVGSSWADQRSSVWTSIALLCVAIVVIYFETFGSMAEIWLRSETFTHGIIIFPISVYLIWCKRDILSRTVLEPFLPGAIVLIAIVLVWAIADLLGIQVLEHFAVVTMLPAVVLVVAGKHVFRVLAFPLAYLLFAVPFGEALIPWLIEYTATFTVKALALIGIPVVRDGIYFAIPSGNFEVAPACSGVRYLLASMAVGSLYGYITYSSFRKRLLFFLFSIALPIVANGFRAFFIVLLAHYSEMKVAVGVDHIIYGWVFFGFVILVMTIIGARYRDSENLWKSSMESRQDDINNVAITPTPRLIPLIIIGCLFIGPALGKLTERHQQFRVWSDIGLPTTVTGWSIRDVTEPEWRPAFSGWSRHVMADYHRNGYAVRLDVFEYRNHAQDHEMASATNRVVDESSGWAKVDERILDIELRDATTVRLHQVHARSADSQRTMWYWLDVGGRQVSGDLQVKLHEAWGLLMESGVRSSAIVISTKSKSDKSNEMSNMVGFLESAYPAIVTCLRVDSSVPQCQGGQVGDHYYR